MKSIALLLAFALCGAGLTAGDIVVQKAQGEVSVRHGVTEGWNRVAAGDVLKPGDTRRTGRRGNALIVVPAADGGGGTRRITLPAEVIVDLSDVRELSQEELMLKLAMEKVRSTAPEQEDLTTPHAAVVHGESRGPADAASENSPETGVMMLNGTRVLFANGFYPTCALKAMEVFRFYPGLAARFENRLLVAEALEKAKLKGDALSEYGGMLTLAGLTPAQESMIRERMAALRK
jgi:hypothetical protein